MRGIEAQRGRFDYLSADTFDIRPYDVVVEADDLEPSTYQVLCSRDVTQAAAVLFAVEFNDESCFEADEVCYVSANRVLATELQPVELSATEPPPEIILNVHRGAAH